MILIAPLAFAAVLPDLNKWVYPLAPVQKAPKITLDAKAAPDLEPWGRKAQIVVQEWFPQVCQLLSTQGYKPSKELRLVFRTKQDAPAYCAGSEISMSAEWVRAHPDDLGMMVHEMTHYIQAYPDNKHDTGWLVEGIADYIRWWRYEPESPRSRIDFTKATYHDAYRTTANWLAWTTAKYDRRLVPALDAVLRKAGDPMPVFKELTGRTADELWSEFKAASSR